MPRHRPFRYFIHLRLWKSAAKAIPATRTAIDTISKVESFVLAGCCVELPMLGRFVLPPFPLGILPFGTLSQKSLGQFPVKPPFIVPSHGVCVPLVALPPIEGRVPLVFPFVEGVSPLGNSLVLPLVFPGIRFPVELSPLPPPKPPPIVPIEEMLRLPAFTVSVLPAS